MCAAPTSGTSRAPISGARAADRLLPVLALLVFAPQLLGSLLPRAHWWGLNGLSFFPAALSAAWTAAVVLALLLVFRRSGGGAPPAGLVRFLDSAAAPVLFALLFVAIAWFFRVRHLLLGDGLPLVEELPLGTAFHYREPLSYALQQFLYRAAGGQVVAAPDMAAQAIAARAVAIGSVVAGGLFAFVAWFLGRELAGAGADAVATSRAGPGEPARATAVDPVAAVLIALLLCSQGYALLFFGYVENYTFVTTASAIYLLAGHRFLGGRWPLWPAGVAAALATALHLSAAVLWPSFLALTAIGLLQRRRGAVLAGLAITGVGLLGLSVALERLHPGYRWLKTLSVVGRVAVTGGEAGMYRAYLGSLLHLRDLLNEQMLIGPMGLLLLVPAAVMAARRRALLRPVPIFLGLAALAWLAATLTIGDTNLGYARDWDLMAPGGLFYLVAGLALLGATGGPGAPGRRFLAGALMLSLFQFVPWVAINASERLAVARVERLPLSQGRSEALVATWHLRRGELPEAAEWYRRAIEVSPRNYVAISNLAFIEAGQGRNDEAVLLYRRAVELRPDLKAMREGLIGSLAATGQYEAAIREREWLLARDATDDFSWTQYAQLLTRVGRYEEAMEASRRALALNPDNARAGGLLRELERRTGRAPVSADSAR